MMSQSGELLPSRRVPDSSTAAAPADERNPPTEGVGWCDRHGPAVVPIAEAARSLSLVLLSLALLPVTSTCVFVLRASQQLLLLLQCGPKASTYSAPGSASPSSSSSLLLLPADREKSFHRSRHRSGDRSLGQAADSSGDDANDHDDSEKRNHSHNDIYTHGHDGAQEASSQQKRAQHRQRQQRRRTVLVTGVGMAKGLTLARAFYQCGHRVIGADVESHGIPCSGRFSRALSRFYKLQRPGGSGSVNSSSSSSSGHEYVRSLVDIIEAEGVDLWVSCSGVSSAAEDAEAKEVIEAQTGCRCIQFDVATTMELHEKDTFMRAAKGLGLPVPETHDVTSPQQVMEILRRSNRDETSQQRGDGGSTGGSKRCFILKTVGVDDTHRANMTLLPLSSSSASSGGGQISWPDTEQYVARLPISEQNPWIVQQFVPGGQEYCTHALVVRNEVRCFTACPSAELLMHYEALQPSSALYAAMLEFTRAYVARHSSSGGKSSADRGAAGEMTGHLSFDFMVEDVAASGSCEKYERRLYAIECNPRAHTAVVLFAQHDPAMEAMVEAYISATREEEHESKLPSKGTTSKTNGDGRGACETDVLVSPAGSALPRYWLTHDLVALVLQPLARFLFAHDAAAGRELVGGVLKLLEHVLTWKEGTFEVWDPMPAFWLYHVYWPLTILSAMWHGVRWSRVNVSTTKMFMM
ncbi:hypothetical protein MN608_08936 [Microdochium nivale]|nr:hypothetical protein MN608_08936 [Microdochium nivale]